MAAVMYRAAQIEDSTSNEIAEKVARLEYENKHLRQLLQFSTPRDQLVVDHGSHGTPPARNQTPFNTDKETGDIIR